MSYREEKFTEIFRTNGFQGKESKSGVGSELVQTETIRRELPKLFTQLHVHTLVDAPCGDCYWIRSLWLGIPKYVGIDIVDELIQYHRKSYGGSHLLFLRGDIVEDAFPKGLGELLLCRDCFVHLSFESVKKALKNFAKSDIPFLLTTTFPEHACNHDYPDGTNWYSINLQTAPFFLPKPLLFIREGCTEDNGRFSDKSLGLWTREQILTCGF